MRWPRATFVSLALLLVALLLWQATRFSSNSPSQPVPPPTPAATPTRLLPTAEPRRPSSLPPERSALADALNAPGSDIVSDLRLVAGILETFRSNFLQTGNPTGTNAEITAALTGQNPLRLALIPPDHPAINRAGELCDRWGSPIFFHAESASRVDIRSAGPDQKLWNDDDIVISP